MPKYTLSELAQLLDGQIQGGQIQVDGSIEISGAATLDTVVTGQITFADGAAALAKVADCRGTAVIIPRGETCSTLPAIAVADVAAAFAQVVQLFHPAIPRRTCGIHPGAHVSPHAKIGPGTDILPGAYIADGVEIGANCWIGPYVTILEQCRLGDNVTLFPHVVMYERTQVGDRCIVHAHAVLGAYGFGYKTVGGKHQLSAQLGWVELQSDVEIGAGSTVDRGTYGPTVVGEGTKVDNQVMIAHNCRIGRHNLLCSQVGIAGSSTTGDYVVMAGQVGVPDHVRIGHRAILGAKAGILRDVPDGQTVLGIPATPERQQLQIQASIARLPEMRKEMREVRRRLDQIQTSQANAPAAEPHDGRYNDGRQKDAA